jgi:hypothetical protein
MRAPWRRPAPIASEIGVAEAAARRRTSLLVDEEAAPRRLAEAPRANHEFESPHAEFGARAIDLTATYHDEASRGANERGVADYLAKPYSPLVLLRWLDARFDRA